MSINITATWILSSNCVNFWAKWLSFRTDTSKGQNKYNVKFYTISSKLMTELCDRKKVAQLSGEYHCVNMNEWSKKTVFMIKYQRSTRLCERMRKKHLFCFFKREYSYIHISNYSHVFMKVKMHSEFLSINIIINFSYQ